MLGWWTKMWRCAWLYALAAVARADVPGAGTVDRAEVASAFGASGGLVVVK